MRWKSRLRKENRKGAISAKTFEKYTEAYCCWATKMDIYYYV